MEKIKSQVFALHCADSPHDTVAGRLFLQHTKNISLPGLADNGLHGISAYVEKFEMDTQ